MTVSHSLRKRFIKDFNLPIQLIQDPYFDYFIDLYDPIYKTKSKYVMFKEAVGTLGGEEAFFAENTRIKEAMITQISESSAFDKLVNFTNKDQTVPKTRKENLYSMANVGKFFVAIDMVKANFQSLKRLDKDLVLGAESYDSLVEQFTSLEYFKKAKWDSSDILAHVKISIYLLF